MKQLKKGDRVRLKVDSFLSRKSKTGTVVETGSHKDGEGSHCSVWFLKDGSFEEEIQLRTCHVLRYQVAKMRDQTPNPEHVNYLSKQGKSKAS